MTALFWTTAGVAVLSTALAITRAQVVHALLYLVLSLLAVALVMYLLGAPFVAALEVIIYAGAIVVLFVFVVMMLNPGPEAHATERSWLSRREFVGPVLLAAILTAELVYALFRTPRLGPGPAVAPDQVAIDLFGPYALGVELASMLLLAALVGAHHLGRRR